MIIGQLFQQFDPDSNGHIDSSELRLAIRHIQGVVDQASEQTQASLTALAQARERATETREAAQAAVSRLSVRIVPGEVERIDRLGRQELSELFVASGPANEGDGLAGEKTSPGVKSVSFQGEETIKRKQKPSAVALSNGEKP
ncbi:MAG: hypothetical protein SGPRY_009860 [Prymnesium sp.]